MGAFGEALLPTAPELLLDLFFPSSTSVKIQSEFLKWHGILKSFFLLGVLLEGEFTSVKVPSSLSTFKNTVPITQNHCQGTMNANALFSMKNNIHIVLPAHVL